MTRSESLLVTLCYESDTEITMHVVDIENNVLRHGKTDLEGMNAFLMTSPTPHSVIYKPHANLTASLHGLDSYVYAWPCSDHETVDADKFTILAAFLALSHIKKPYPHDAEVHPLPQEDWMNWINNDYFQ